MPLHDHVLNSEAPQENGSGKAHQGSADDENWYRFRFVSAHVDDVYQAGLAHTRRRTSRPVWLSAVCGAVPPGKRWH
ncbi:putative Tetracenomycin polyketide synthesis hydroxylase TcmG [Streptomyces viridochromogenes Tue57]|uniref:Putative Tetracenomycin polyketide synthesis hydroxylase TcmG n=1 Tax=Streptomyces viridochromogenes Tue57 TaxID=1160705 RepID=L8PM92_STRVR|nr:putative Tetracenomycin polyketide synthesis hydroxylase TcmG [Streptomyces viridochromogenes Tue57]